MRRRPLGRNTWTKWENKKSLHLFKFFKTPGPEKYWVKYWCGEVWDCIRLYAKNWLMETHPCPFWYGNGMNYWEKKKKPSLVHSVVFGTILPGWFTFCSGQNFYRRQLLENFWLIDMDEVSRRNLNNRVQCTYIYYWQTWGCVTHYLSYQVKKIILRPDGGAQISYRLGKFSSGLFCGFSWNILFMATSWELEVSSFIWLFTYIN